jgi:hypothetical protein
LTKPEHNHELEEFEKFSSTGTPPKIDDLLSKYAAMDMDDEDD